MASKALMQKTVKELSKWYPKGIPAGVLAEEVKISEEEAEAFLATEPIPVVRRKRTVRKKPDPVHKVALSVLPYGAGVIAVIALGRSILFTYNYFTRTENIITAVFMAVLFGLVGYLAPAISILSFQLRKWFIFLFAFGAFVLFSWINIYITVEELNMNKVQRETQVVNVQEEVISARRRVPILEQELIRVQESLVLDKREFDGVLALSLTPGIPSWEYNRHRLNLATIRERIDGKENQIKSITDERNLLTSLEGYYTYIEVTEQDKEEARRMDSVFALSLEVIGPIFATIALFIR